MERLELKAKYGTFFRDKKVFPGSLTEGKKLDFTGGW